MGGGTPKVGAALHHLNFFILNVNDEHFFTAGDCHLKTFLNIMKHRLVFKVLTNKCITNI